MARNLRHLPGREAGVNVFGELLTLFAQPLDFFGDINCRLTLHIAKLLDLGFQIGHGLLKVEKMTLAHGRFASCILMTATD